MNFLRRMNLVGLLTIPTGSHHPKWLGIAQVETSYDLISGVFFNKIQVGEIEIFEKKHIYTV